MTAFDDVEPTQGAQGNSFEWLLDVANFTPNDDSPDWLNIPDMTGFQPQSTPKMQDGTTYANKGGTSQQKTGEDFATQVQVKGVKDNTGEFQPELVLLINAADSVGTDNIVRYRYYHATSGALAYQGTASVNWSRANTGNDDIEFFQIDLTGQGDRHKITNPNSAATVPTIVSITPDSAGAGDTVTITGTGFSDATAVTFDGVDATSFTPVSGTGGTKITAVLPAGNAGLVDVVVSNSTGDSAAFSYTRS